MRRRAAAAILAVPALLAVSVPAGPAGARSAQEDGASPARLALAAIPAWIERGATVNVDVRVEPVTADLEIQTILYERLRSRIAFQRTVTGDSLGSVQGTATLALSRLDAGRVGTHRIPIDLGSRPTQGRSASIPVSEPGVYPLQLQLRVRGAEAVVDRLITHVVVLDEDNPPRERLAVAWLWPLLAELPWAPDGRPSDDLAESLTPAGRLAQFTDALVGTSSVPLTLLPEPATLDAWNALAAQAGPGGDEDPEAPPTPQQRLDTFRDALEARNVQVLTAPYADLDVRALIEAGLGDDLALQLAHGADVLRETLDLRPDPRVLAPGSTGPPALARLRAAGADRLVLPEGSLVAEDSNITPAQPFRLPIEGREFVTAAADPELSRLITPQPSPPDATGDEPSDAGMAQRFLAGLAMVALEAPSEPRGVVILPRRDWHPSANLLATTLQGLSQHPALRPVTIDGFFERLGGNDISNLRIRRLDPPADVPDLAITDADVDAAREQLAALVSMRPGEDRPMVERQILMAESDRWSPDEREIALRFLGAAQRHLQQLIAAVGLPGEHTVTLTARQGDVPVTFINQSSDSLRVAVRLRSDKLLFPDGSTHEVELPPRSSTIRFTVEARTSGTFPLDIEVLSPDELVLIGDFRLTIRSTAVSGIALGMTIAAAVFLFGWWANHIRKARRARRAHETLGHG